MLEIVRGDILKVDCEALVNTVNCVGVMGRGIALQFKKAFPENFKAYQKACKAKKVQVGRMLVHDLGRLTNPRFIINFPTKKHWRAKSKLSDIEAGLRDLVAVVRKRGIRSIAIPPLGCGLGGLEWPVVRERIQAAFEQLADVDVLLFEPAGAPEAERMATTTKPPRMTPGRAALLALMHRYLAALLDPFVTLLEIHKLMYFMQEAGENLRLRYEKGPYGPYAENLRHALNEIEGHWISGYGDAEDAPYKEIQVSPDGVDQAHDFLAGARDTQDHLQRVQDLIEGFETPFGMELLASVHWIGKQESASGVEDATDRMYAWSERKRQFEPHQIKLAWQTLESKGWLVR